MDVFDAYLFIKHFLAHATDGTISDEEWDQIVKGAAKRAKELGLRSEEMQVRVQASNEAYWRLFEENGPKLVTERFRQSIVVIRAAVQDEAVTDALLADLEDLAAADGMVDDMERHFLDEVTRSWKGKTTKT